MSKDGIYSAIFSELSFFREPGFAQCSDVIAVPFEFKTNNCHHPLGSVRFSGVNKLAHIPCTYSQWSCLYFLFLLFALIAGMGFQPAMVCWAGLGEAGIA